MCNMSFGETRAVARAKLPQCTVGKVAMAPLESEWGSGHIRIMMSSFRPSCLRVRARAAKRLSFATRRWTIDFRRERESRKDAVLPAMVAEAAMNQLGECKFTVELEVVREGAYPFGNPYTKPAIVKRLEYPINGGNDTKNIRNQSISQPPGISLHLFATGCSFWNILSL